MSSTTRKNLISSTFSHLNSFFPMFFSRGLPVYRICHGGASGDMQKKVDFTVREIIHVCHGRIDIIVPLLTCH
jgi:hypothetical protein